MLIGMQINVIARVNNNNNINNTTVFPLRTTWTSFSTSNFFVFFLIFSHPRFYESLKKIIIIISFAFSFPFNPRDL